MILYELKILFQFKEIKSKFEGTRDDSYCKYNQAERPINKYLLKPNGTLLNKGL